MYCCQIIFLNYNSDHINSLFQKLNNSPLPSKSFHRVFKVVQRSVLNFPILVLLLSTSCLHGELHQCRSCFSPCTTAQLFCLLAFTHAIPLPGIPTTLILPAKIPAFPSRHYKKTFMKNCLSLEPVSSLSSGFS